MVSQQTANTVAGALESLYSLIPFQPEPPLTRVAVSMLANSTTLDISAAKNELGYGPRVSVDEGFHKFIEWWKEKN